MVKFMKKLFLFIVLPVLLIASCNDPIFYTITKEYKQRNPYIRGASTNFVEFNNMMYVASGRQLYNYLGTGLDGRGIWEKRPLNGRAVSIASTSEHLYVLYEDSSGNTLIKYDTSFNSTILNSNGYKFQNIFTANDKLFVGAKKADYVYSILFFDGSGYIELTDTPPETELLKQARLLYGAVYLEQEDEYYFCAVNFLQNGDGGIYKAPNELSPGAAKIFIDNAAYIGIINLGETFAAITRDGELHDKSGTFIANLGGRKSNGGLTIWREDPNDPASSSLLLASRQDDLTYSLYSGYTYGYLEIELENGKIKPGAAFRDPGTLGPSSIIVGEYDRYISSLGKYPVNHLFQTSVDGTLFASTQLKGVWSYRIRDDNPYPTWNAED